MLCRVVSYFSYFYLSYFTHLVIFVFLVFFIVFLLSCLIIIIIFNFIYHVLFLYFVYRIFFYYFYWAQDPFWLKIWPKSAQEEAHSSKPATQAVTGPAAAGPAARRKAGLGLLAWPFLSAHRPRPRRPAPLPFPHVVRFSLPARQSPSSCCFLLRAWAPTQVTFASPSFPSPALA